MKAISSIIIFHQGPPRGHSFFYIGEGGKANRDARVSSRKIVEIRQKIESQQRTGNVILGINEILFIHLPHAFLRQLQKVGIEPVAAWNYMAGSNGKTPASGTASPTAKERKNSLQAHRLARILSGVSGGKKSPVELILELMDLISMHKEEALGLLDAWTSYFGFCERTGKIIVENRANKAARKTPASSINSGSSPSLTSTTTSTK